MPAFVLNDVGCPLNDVDVRIIGAVVGFYWRIFEVQSAPNLQPARSKPFDDPISWLLSMPRKGLRKAPRYLARLIRPGIMPAHFMTLIYGAFPFDHLYWHLSFMGPLLGPRVGIAIPTILAEVS